jgi:hypothetical protein
VKALEEAFGLPQLSSVLPGQLGAENRTQVSPAGRHFYDI